MSERRSEQLVQHDKLTPTNQITNPEDIPFDLLELWWRKASLTCDIDEFNAIAFNQFSKSTLQKLDLTPQKACIIYIHDNFQEENQFARQLLINPEIQISGLAPQTVSLEGCGSIQVGENRRPLMFLSRPPIVYGAAYFWKPKQGKPTYQEFSASKALAFFIQHEHAHLNGKTALSQPEIFFDFRQEEVWKELCGVFSSLFGEGILERLVAIERRFIVYDKSEDHFVLVDNKGRSIKERF